MKTVGLMKMVDVSVVIPTTKREVITLSTLNCPTSFEVFVIRKQGLSFARNYGAQQASGDMLVFFDGDLHLDNGIWKELLSTQRGEFRMTRLGGFPCTKAMAIHKSDFWNVGGFDENIQFTGEDRDFYVRALDCGLAFSEVPHKFVHHVDHVERCSNIHVSLKMVKENVEFITKYWWRYPQVFRVDFLDRFKRGQIRTLLLQFVMLLRHILGGTLT